MSDMLVKLYDLPEKRQDTDRDYEIIRPMAPDKFRVVEWVKEHSGISAAGECDVCFSHTPVSMYIAVRGKEILGYACYDATAPDFFLPHQSFRTGAGQGHRKGTAFGVPGIHAGGGLCLCHHRQCGGRPSLL